ncbi:MAG: AAA family ATPase [Bryobacteraceae bacterium]
MLRKLILEGVGPAKRMEVEFADRLNLITGDNGLGKSFLLDVAWWALTRTWAGRMALPREDAKSASITTWVCGKDGKAKERLVPFRFAEQAWKQPKGRPEMPGLVIYAQVDGCSSVWDPARNYGKQGDPDGPSAFLFDSREVWNGLQEGTEWRCNGLLRDWATWQLRDSEEFRLLTKVLQRLSPPTETLKPGQLRRLHPADSRDYPTIHMPYGQDVPVVYASAAIRRILALSYLLIWAWTEHLRAVELRHEKATNRFVFLVDEVESHLHPSWQRRILPCLLEVVGELKTANGGPQIQVLASTHAPLVCVSLEEFFDEERDRLLDLDLDSKGEVRLEPVEFQRRGRASNWLVSRHFDLNTEYSERAEQALESAGELVRKEMAKPGSVKKTEFLREDRMLRSILGDLDPFWVRWRRVGEKYGWLK